MTMRTTRSLFGWIPTTILVLSVFAEIASAGRPGTFDDPELFRQAKHKVLVVRFENEQSRLAGAVLAEMLSHYLLATIRDVPSFAVINLGRDHENREVDITFIRELAQRQRTPVAVWGRFLEHEGEMFLYPSIHIFPDALDDAQRKRIAFGSHEGRWQGPAVRASLPSMQIPFPPVALPAEAIDHLESMRGKDYPLLEQPNSNAQQSGELAFTEPHFLAERRGEWSRFTTVSHGSGWLRHEALFDQKYFAQLQVTTLYAQALMQYVAGSNASARRSFEQCLARLDSKAARIAVATARILVTYSDYANTSPDDLAAGFEAAQRILPSSAAPVNCQAVVAADAIGRGRLGKQQWHELEGNLIRTIQRTGDVDAIQNLASFYEDPAIRDFYPEIPENELARQLADRLKLLQEIAASKGR